MHLSIRTKLFLTLLLGGLLVVVGTHAFIYWSFRQGVTELADAREQERIGAIADRLIDAYSENQSWQPLRADTRRWIAILVGGVSQGPGRQGPGRRFGGLPPWIRHGAIVPEDWPPAGALEHMRLRGRPMPLELRLMLFDANGGIVYGHQSRLEGIRRYPLTLDGESIGTLVLLPGPPVAEIAELQFQSRQGGRLWIIALAMLLLSAALAYPLSRRLVRPVRRFQETARRLAAGDFSARVPEDDRDEIGRLGRDINALAVALQHNEKARGQWFADISHELRTPIALMHAELEALQDGVRPLDRAAVDALHEDVLRLGRLVDDLYDLSMTDMGALSYRMEDTDVSEVLAGDIESFREQFAAAELYLDYRNLLAEPVIRRADRQRLSQLFRNLLRNSLRYTNPGGGCIVTLARNDRWLTVDIEDTAPGVPAEALPRLFDRLYRVEISRSRHTGGAGLGLSIAKNVVEAHQGRIAAAGSEHGGLWIHIELPI